MVDYLLKRQEAESESGTYRNRVLDQLKPLPHRLLSVLDGQTYLGVVGTYRGGVF
jgi:hypothetical protein